MSLLFSIIIPCYNQAHFLPDCLESLLAQQYQDWEAIVVNDGSMDDTNQVASVFQERDPRIKLINKQNGGLSSARNEGIKQSSGNRFIFLDADDFLYDRCLAELSTNLNIVNDDVLIQYGYTYISEKKDKELQTVIPSQRNQLIPDIFSNILAPCHSICISKTLIDAAGPFDENLKSLEDWDFWLRVAKSGAKHSVISKPLAYYRYVKNSMSRNPFTMYESFKIVANRALLKDSRVTVLSSFNKEYKHDMSPFLQRALMSVLGVAIMQNKIEESVRFFNMESKKEMNQIVPSDFEPMCSYLSFRYWYEREDIKIVFSDFYPKFELFFNSLGYDKQFVQKACYNIFKRHLFFRNKYKYGKQIGSAVNYFVRKKGSTL
jgi:glycosyltransferase involved in cell wall biosynthesis